GLIEEALHELRQTEVRATLDQLAVDYADVYLRHAYRASPSESVWLTEDGLERQGPALAIRSEHRRHGVVLVDPDKRPEDHLVPQLRFAAYLLASAPDGDGPSAAARF